MRFIVDADLPRQTVTLLRQYGHEADDVRDSGLTSAPDREIAEHAQRIGACIITGDFGFADMRNYPPSDYAGIVVIEIPARATASSILRLIETFVQQAQIVSKVPGRLAIVEWGRIRLRPA